MRIRLLLNGIVREMDLEAYVPGVVKAEMPTFWPIEALKAQAVAARSYAFSAIESPRHEKEGADLCASSHCQNFSEEGDERSVLAARLTEGSVLTFEGEVCEACYFAHCDGRTRNAEEVWGERVEYLQSVECDCGFEELSGHGVGMCQWGAKAMAEKGASFEEILFHYYQVQNSLI